MEEILVKRYKASDGTLFESAEECKKYEDSTYCKIKMEIMPTIEEAIKKCMEVHSKLPF